MKNPRLKLTPTGWQCSGELGHYKIIESGPTLATAYIKYNTAMRDLIKKDPINAFHQPRK